MKDDNVEGYDLNERCSEDRCIEIYKNILQKDTYNDNIVHQIVRKTARVVLMVELLAKTAREAGLTDDILLEKLNICGFDLAEIAEKAEHHENDKKTFNKHLRKAFEIAVSLYNASNTTIFDDRQNDDNALNFFREILTIRKNIFDEEHPDTVSTYNNIAWIYHKQANYNKALYFYNKALAIIEKIHGREHPDTAKNYNDIAWVYRNQGDYDKASEFYDKAFNLLIKVKENRHDIARTYNGIAAIFRDKGKYKEALEFYKKALVVRDEKIREKYHDTAATYNGIAWIYSYQGKYDEALEYYDKALAIRKNRPDKEYPYTAKTYNCMAMVYHAKGNYDKALKYCDKARVIVQEVLGEEHPLIATTYNIRAGVYSDQGKYNDALEFYDKALIIREKIFGKESLSTAKTYNGMAGAYRGQGNYNEALKYYERALKIREKILDREHPDTARTYNGIAGVYRDQGIYDKTSEFYEKALEIIEKVFGEEHPYTAKTYSNKAWISYRGQSNHSQALFFYKKALKIREKELGEKHSDTAMTYNDIAWVYRDQGIYDKALEYYEKALKIRDDIFDGEHLDIARSFNNIAMMYYNLSNYTESLKYHQKALKIREEKLDKKHLDIARSYNGMAMAYHYNGDFNEAIKYYTNALEIFEEKLNVGDSDIVITYKNLALLHENQNDYKNAIECYRKVGIKNIVEMLVRFKEENREQIIEKGLLNDLLKNDEYFGKITKQAIEQKVLNSDDDLKNCESIYIKSVYIISLLHINETDIAYYTQKNVAEKMFFKSENNTINKFRLSSINYSNDPKEGEILLKYLFEGKVENNQTKNPYRAFAGCFTLNYDCLNQFRLYGKEENKECTGVSIVFKKSFFEESAKLATDLGSDNKYALFRCIYIDPHPKTNKKIISVGRKEEFLLYRDEKSKKEIEDYNLKIKNLIEKVSKKLTELKTDIKKYKLDENVVSQLLINLRYLTKHVAFKEEQECRIVKVENVKKDKVKTSENKMYLEYLEIGQYVEKIYFAPNASDMDIFQDRLLNEGREIKCIESDNPFKPPS
jgi:tetratricopeptide (TPR) repeat protein